MGRIGEMRLTSFSPRFRIPSIPPTLSKALRRLTLCAVLGLAALARATAEEPVPWSVGMARVDITPDGPVRLTGYASRQTESDGIAQRLWAKGLAISWGSERPAVLITVDTCGLCEPIAAEVARRLEERNGLPRERLVFCSSHTHSGPQTRGFAPNIFVADLPADQKARIERYSNTLIENLVSVALAAQAGLEPADLSWSQGEVGFARNRRTEGGPTDPALPILVVHGRDGDVRAVLANYACHCTTLGGEFNRTHGDWAGCAQEEIERRFPRSVGLISIGCGADANPFPRGSVEHAQAHGVALADEVVRLVRGPMKRLRHRPVCRIDRFALPFQRLPGVATWEERSAQSGILGYHGRRRLAEARGGVPLPTELPYIVQTWSFGDDLAMVFLAGEVVVDYSKRLKVAFDPARLWVTAYANDVPCYIPSRRILNEGGYEAESSLWYYDRPTRLAPECEDLIIDHVEALLPATIRLADHPDAAQHWAGR
jgi:Neutral/alkaline non-lysosomal ceramidase, N-terminal